MQLELTDNECLILTNQYEILGTLKEDDAYLRLAEQLRDGQNGYINKVLMLLRRISPMKVQSL